MKAAGVEEAALGAGAFAPLAIPIYGRVWSASLFANFGALIQGVGAAWAMTQLSGDPAQVALVQTAAMLPLMLWSVPSGAISDMFDRRLVALTGLTLASASAAGLFALTYSGLITPLVLLLFCFMINTGLALYSPAWQASVAEQVPSDALPRAIALNAISYNVARSFGPAIGGVVVALAGAAAAFAANALLYWPIILVFLTWRRVHVTPRLPPERLDRAILSGVRYVFYTPRVRAIVIRTFLFGAIGGALAALMPLVARQLLGGDAFVYGMLLGAMGIGAVAGALMVGRLRNRFSSEAIALACTVAMGCAMIMVGFSRYLPLTIVVLILAGFCWTAALSLKNINVQVSAPRWVSGRVLSAYQAAVTGGIATGSWIFGHVARDHGTASALYVAGGAMILSITLSRWLPMAEATGPAVDGALLSEPEVALALTPRSGPIVVEVEYRVPAEHARQFYQRMLEVQSMRQRNGSYGWSIARDIGDVERWTERFHTPTWLEYLRQRDRPTQADRDIMREASEIAGGAPVMVRRSLERPFGSVRWLDEVPDREVHNSILLG